MRRVGFPAVLAPACTRAIQSSREELDKESEGAGRSHEAPELIRRHQKALMASGGIRRHQEASEAIRRNRQTHLPLSTHELSGESLSAKNAPAIAACRS